MEKPDWDIFGQAMGVIGIIITAAYGIWRGHAKAEGKPPADRPPTQNETKAAFDELRADMARLHAKHDRQAEISSDEWREVFRQLDRIEAAQRLETAMHGIRREMGGG